MFSKSSNLHYYKRLMPELMNILVCFQEMIVNTAM